MTNKATYTSGKDPLSGCDMLYHTEDGRRQGIVAATPMEDNSLSPAAVLKAVATMLNGQTPDVVSLPNNLRICYARPESGMGVMLRVREAGEDMGTSVRSVSLNGTGSSPDLTAAVFSKMNKDFMAAICNMFDGLSQPVPQGGGHKPGAPLPPRA